MTPPIRRPYGGHWMPNWLFRWIWDRRFRTHTWDGKAPTLLYPTGIASCEWRTCGGHSEHVTFFFGGSSSHSPHSPIREVSPITVDGVRRLAELPKPERDQAILDVLDGKQIAFELSRR